MSKIRADFEGLLELAETLRRSYEKHEEMYRKLFTAYQGLLLLLLLEAYGGLFIVIFSFDPRSFAPHSRPLPIPIAFTFASADLLLILATGFYAYSSWLRSIGLKRVGREDKRDLTEVVELLREIEPVVAKEESLSALERVQIRIRLSRFGVGSSSRSGATAASKELEADFRARAARVDQELAKPF